MAAVVPGECADRKPSEPWSANNYRVGLEGFVCRAVLVLNVLELRQFLEQHPGFPSRIPGRLRWLCLLFRGRCLQGRRLFRRGGFGCAWFLLHRQWRFDGGFQLFFDVRALCPRFLPRGTDATRRPIRHAVVSRPALPSRRSSNNPPYGTKTSTPRPPEQSFLVWHDTALRVGDGVDVLAWLFTTDTHSNIHPVVHVIMTVPGVALEASWCSLRAGEAALLAHQVARSLRRADWKQEIKHGATINRRYAGVAADSAILLANMLRRITEGQG